MNAWNRIAALVAKEFRHLGRDRRTLAVVLALPVLQMILFAYAISFDVKNVSTVVIDQDRTPASAAYLRSYASSDFFHVVGTAGSLADVDRIFDHNEARIAVLVPPGFGRSLAAGEKATVAVYLDGSEPTAARVGQAFATALNQSYGQKVAIEWADAQGVDVTAAGQLEPRVRTWYNPERRSSDFLIPGLMVVIIMVVAVQQTAVSLVREREQGTDEQLAISPLAGWEMMIGKLAPWTLLAFGELAAITAVGMAFFALPLRGSLGVLALGAGLFVFCSLGLGLVISAVAPSLESANMLGLLLSILPAFVLSGFAFPLSSVPVVLQWVSSLFPARFMVDISRGVFLKGAGITELWPELAALSIYAVVVIAVAVMLSSRRRR
ncbi:MAG: ABC transporter permease [Micropruina sp.]|uniref:ABC transporter permease n=1 Tax=Micropruina sp. TaxID=2737536 RepID=UPI0039E3CAFB